MNPKYPHQVSLWYPRQLIVRLEEVMTLVLVYRPMVCLLNLDTLPCPKGKKEHCPPDLE